MSEADRRSRAAARAARMTLHRTRLQPHEADFSPVAGEDALSLVTRLTEEGWTAAGLPEPSYSRSEIPVRFVRRKR